jgi:hypothetical protein
MGVISFRRPEEGIAQFSTAIDVIQEILRNPNVGSIAKQLTKEMQDSARITEDLQQQAQNAQEVIAQSKEFLEEFEAEKSKHAAQVKTDNDEIMIRRSQLENDLSAFIEGKTSYTEQLKKDKTSLEDKVAQAKKYNDSANIVLAKADQKEKELSILKNAHDAEVLKFAEDKQHAEIELNDNIQSHQAAVQKLENDRKAFELRKKKFEDALKE